MFELCFSQADNFSKSFEKKGDYFKLDYSPSFIWSPLDHMYNTQPP